jgi:hypothetical protein
MNKKYLAGWQVEIQPLIFSHSPSAFDAQIAFTLKAYCGVDWETLQEEARPSIRECKSRSRDGAGGGGIMSFDRIVEAIIKEAMERGEFENLPGKGKPIDLTAYFDTPEEVRMVHSILKSAGMAPREVDLLKEIAELKQILEALLDEKKQQETQGQIEKKQVEFSLMMEQHRRQRKQK